MSKKEEKKPAQEAKAEKGPPDEIAETRKKRKLVLIAGIAGVVLTAALAGGFFVYKTFMTKSASMAAKSDHGKTDGAHDSKDSGKDKDAAKHDSKDGAKHDSKDGAKDDKKDAAKDDKKDAAKDDKKDAAKDEKKDDKKDAAKDDKKEDKKDAAKDEKKDAKKDGGKDDKKDDKKDASKDGKKDGKSDASGGDKKDEKADLKAFKSDEQFGETFQLPRMDLNLGNPLENRYLRIAVSIEFTGGKTQGEELKKREPQIRDLIISSVSSRTRLDLLSERGKEKLRRELINKMNESFERPVKTIYFTDFLVE
ncbi:MAG: hypothetical protein EBR09_00260 [Proteobacteria bacterium]|nr:hypothetical protein [Pseudomonadota bacterium]